MATINDKHVHNTATNETLKTYNGPRREETCLQVVVNNTVADKHHMLIVTGEISNCQLVSIAEETGLKHALLDTTKTGFLATRSKCNMSELMV